MADQMDSGAQRSQKIMEELLRAGEISIEHLARQLKVSPSTVRRDLGELERQGLLRRTHGGAVLGEPLLYEPFRHVSSFQEQEQQRAAEKRRIGLAAGELVSDGEVIGIGAGTTTTQVARSIRHRKNITVVTNTINIAMELSHRENLKVFLTGGFLSGDWFALVGPAAVESAGELFADRVFIGVDGIHAEYGPTTNYPEQAAVHRAMIRQGRQKIVVADQTKLGKIGIARICPITEIDLLVTDNGATDDAIAPFSAKGIQVIRAGI